MEELIILETEIIKESRIAELAGKAVETAIVVIAATAAAVAKTGPPLMAHQVRALADKHYFVTSDSQRLQIIQTFSNLDPESPFITADHNGLANSRRLLHYTRGSVAYSSNYCSMRRLCLFD